MFRVYNGARAVSFVIGIMGSYLKLSLFGSAFFIGCIVISCVCLEQDMLKGV